MGNRYGPVPATVFVTIQADVLTDGTPCYAGWCNDEHGDWLGACSQGSTPEEAQRDAAAMIAALRKAVGTEPEPHALWFQYIPAKQG